jgi:excisionase family DNA binding protein
MPSKHKATGETPTSTTLVDSRNILTPAQLAERLQVSPSWVRQKTRSRCPNPLPHYKIGRYLRFDWSAVSAWLQASEVRA